MLLRGHPLAQFMGSQLTLLWFLGHHRSLFPVRVSHELQRQPVCFKMFLVLQVQIWEHSDHLYFILIKNSKYEAAQRQFSSVAGLEEKCNFPLEAGPLQGKWETNLKGNQGIPPPTLLPSFLAGWASRNYHS